METDRAEVLVPAVEKRWQSAAEKSYMCLLPSPPQHTAHTDTHSYRSTPTQHLLYTNILSLCEQNTLLHLYFNILSTVFKCRLNFVIVFKEVWWYSIFLFMFRLKPAVRNQLTISYKHCPPGMEISTRKMLVKSVSGCSMCFTHQPKNTKVI